MQRSAIYRANVLPRLDEIDHSLLHPRRVFIQSALDKEIRLSFAKRVVDSIPDKWKAANIITQDQMKEQPDFPYADPEVPYAQEGKELYTIMRKKEVAEHLRAPGQLSLVQELQVVLDRVTSLAKAQGVDDPLVTVTDIFVTVVCHLGSKSLSHVLTAIDKVMGLLVAIGPASEAARRQIITSVMTYWQHHPGTAVNIINKLLNFLVLTPMSIIEWSLHDRLDRGRALANTATYELVTATAGKYSKHIRDMVSNLNSPLLYVALQNGGFEKFKQDKARYDAALLKSRQAMRDLFEAILDAVTPVMNGSNDEMMETMDENGADGTSAGAGSDESKYVRAWAEKWVRVWKRKAAVEEAYVGEAAVSAAAAVCKMNVERMTPEEYAALEAEAAAIQAKADAEAAEVERQKQKAAGIENGNGGADVGDGHGNGDGEPVGDVEDVEVDLDVA